MKKCSIRGSKRNPRHRWVVLIAGLCLFAIATPWLRATTVVPPTFAELVNESDYIVRAVVKSVSSAWQGEGDQRHIVTKIEVDVLEVINGTPPTPLVLEMLGGQVGDVAMVIDGFPTFQVGQEDILFVRGNGRQIYPLTAAMHGRYPIHREKDGHGHVMRSNHVPLHSTNEVALSIDSSTSGVQTQASADASTALSPEAFVQQIRAAVNVNYPRKK